MKKLDYFLIVRYSVSCVLLKEDYRQHFRPNYFDYQPELVPSHRSVLVDWMVEVAEHFRITRQTLHMAVGYVDRFVSFYLLLYSSYNTCVHSHTKHSTEQYSSISLKTLVFCQPVR